jgi:hypothetical protein
MKADTQQAKHWFLTLILSTLVSMSFTSSAEEASNTVVKSPIRLDKDMISGIGLEATPWPDEARLTKWSFLYTGSELSVSVFESRSKKLEDSGKGSKAFVKGYPYDQFVIVLSGKSVLTDEAGRAQSFSAGDFFVVPKGFTGTWEEFGVYRELIVVLEEAVRTRPLDIELIK